MREINLQEYQQSGPFQLSAGERDLLMERGFDIDVEPAAGSDTEYHLRAGSTVGALQVGNLSVLIEPKIRNSQAAFIGRAMPRAGSNFAARISSFPMSSPFPTPWPWRSHPRRAEHSRADCCTAIVWRRKPCKPSGDGLILTSNSGEGTTLHCPWRCSTMSSLPTYSPTGW